MNCTNCKNYFTIKTNPITCDYDLIEGCTKYATDYDESDIQVLKVQQTEEAVKIMKNPLYKMETEKIDLINAEMKKPVLKKLIEQNV